MDGCKYMDDDDYGNADGDGIDDRNLVFFLEM